MPRPPFAMPSSGLKLPIDAFDFVDHRVLLHYQQFCAPVGRRVRGGRKSRIIHRRIKRCLLLAFKLSILRQKPTSSRLHFVPTC